MRRLCSFIVFVTLLWPGILAAQEIPAKVTGVVKQLDVKLGTVTVRPSRKAAMDDETYSLLRKDIEVTTPSGQKTKLDTVRPGQVVQLKIGPTGDVEAVAIQAPVFLATVSDVDVESQTINISRQEVPPATIAVATDAKISLAGRPAYLREVKPGSQMTVTASLDGKMALGLTLVSDPDGKLASKLFTRVKTSRLPGIRFVGLLTDVDPAKSELQLVGPKTKGVPKSMPVAKDAVIQVIYGQVPVQNLSLNQVAKMAHATLLVSADNQQVTRILVEPPTASAKVTALNADGGQLTVEVEGTKKTFTLRRDFKVMNKTRVMRLADLQPDLPVNLVLSLDRDQLLAVDIRQFVP